MQPKKHPLYILSFFLCFILKISFSQTVYPIKMESNGKIISELPERLLPDNQLSFYIKSSKNIKDSYKLILHEKYINAQKKLAKLNSDPDALDFIDKSFDITSTDLTNLDNDLDKVIKTPSIAPALLTYIPNLTTDKSFNIQILNLDPNQINIKTTENVQTLGTKCKLIQDEKKLLFILFQENLYKKLTIDWLNTTKSLPNLIDNKAIIKKETELKNQVIEAQYFANKIKTYFIQKNKPFVISDVSKLTNIRDSAKYYTNKIIGNRDAIATYLKGKNYKDWLLKWYWYSNEVVPTLNPFDFIPPDDINNLKPDTTILAGLNQKIIAREATIAKMNLNKIRVSQIDSLINETDSLKKVSNNLQNKAQNFKILKITNDNNITDFGTTSKQLDTTILFVSKDDRNNYWMRNHDASNYNQLMNDLLTKDEYLENDKILIVDHNLLFNENVEVHGSTQDITNDGSKIGEALSPLLTSTSAVLGKFKLIAAAASDHSTLGTIKIQAHSAIVDLNRALKETNLYVIYLDQFLSKGNPLTDIKETSDATKCYHSKVIPVVKKEAPKRYTYNLTKTITNASSANTQEVSDSFTLRINKLYRIFPMAGLNYVFNNFNDISYDSANKQSKINTSTHVRFAVGIKVFFRKTDIRSSKAIWEKDENGRDLVWSRFNFSLAVDVSKPLDNIYTGLGFDVVPGFSINTGCAFNKYSYNQYANGQTIQTKSLYRPGFYLGISTDVSLFVDLFKLLNFSK